MGKAVTEYEYKLIKQLIELDVQTAKIVRVTKRSYTVIQAVRDSKDFDEYKVQIENRFSHLKNRDFPTPAKSNDTKTPKKIRVNIQGFDDVPVLVRQELARVFANLAEQIGEK